MSRCLRFKVAILSAILVASTFAYSGESLFAKIPIPNECAQSYEEGYNIFNSSLGKKLSPIERDGHYQQEQNKIIGDCQFAFVLGLYDGQTLFMQRLLLEYALEVDLVQQEDPDNKNAIIDDLKNYFKSRFELVGLETYPVDSLDINSEGFQKILSDFKEKMSSLAQEMQMAIPFERFVFVSGGRTEPYTTSTYVRSPEGKIDYDKDGAIISIKEGSWQRAGKAIWDHTVELAQEYIEWQPAMLWGEDSFLAGSFSSAEKVEKNSFFGTIANWVITAENYYGITDPNDHSNDENLRQVKERYFLNTMSSYITQARKINLNLRPFRKLEKQMMDKQRAYLDRDLKVINGAVVGTFLAPFVPLAIYAGTSGFLGTASRVIGNTAVSWVPAALSEGALLEGAVSFQLVGGGLAFAQNVSASLALAPMAFFAYRGFSSYNEQRELNNEKFEIASAFDHVIAATVTSLPLAAIIPATLGGTLYMGKTLILSVDWVLRGGLTCYEIIKDVGASQFIRSIPRNLLKAWITGWRSKSMLKWNFLADVVGGTVIEIWTRETFADKGWFSESSRFWVRNENGDIVMNKQSVLSIVTSMSVNFLTKPMWVMKSLGGRFVIERAVSISVGFLVTATMNLLISENEHIDIFKRGLFDQAYFACSGNLTREIERGLTLDTFLKNRSGVTVFLLSLLLKQAMSLGKTPIKNILLDAYMDKSNDHSVIDRLRDHFQAKYNIDLQEFTNQDFIGAFDRIREQVAAHSFVLPERIPVQNR